MGIGSLEMDVQRPVRWRQASFATAGIVALTSVGQSAEMAAGMGERPVTTEMKCISMAAPLNASQRLAFTRTPIRQRRSAVTEFGQEQRCSFFFETWPLTSPA